jgi:hypothetical protein
VRYAFDDGHRLIVHERARPHGPPRLVRILDGTVTTDRHNRLLYRVDSSSGIAGTPGPQTVQLDGAWALTPAHELALTLRESDQRERHTVYLKGALVQAEANALVFALRRSAGQDLRAARRLTLSGRWQADARNRLTFLVGKADGSEDRLTLQGGWEVGKRHELLYRYRQRSAGRVREEHTLGFEGRWDITRADRLVYRLTGSDDSAFEFRASLQSPSLNARDGRLIYQVGIGVAGGRTETRNVNLFGTWKLNRDLSVSFEVPYAHGRVQAIRFEGQARVGPRDRIAVALLNSERQPLGLSVTFTRELVPDAGLFLRLRKEAEERSLVGGVHVRF